MGYILKIITVLALAEFYCGASPPGLCGKQFTIVKPTFISTVQFVDRCSATKMCSHANTQAQFVRARISTATKLPSLKVQSSLPGNKKSSHRTSRGKEVFDAVKKNDLKNLAKLVKSHVDVNERDDNGMSALHLAAEKGHVEAAKMLIENGAEIDARDKYFNNPLHIACSHDFAELISYFIDKGANIFAFNLMKLYPLKLCTISIESFRPNLVKAAEKGEKLFNAVESGDLKLVQKLVGQGLNVNFENTCGDTALTVAILKGHKNIANWLVNNGADASLESCDGSSPFDLAKNAGMSLPSSKTADWKSIITSARSTVNQWLVDNPSPKEIQAARKQNYHSLTWIAYHPLGDISDFLKHLCQYNSMICSIREIMDWTKPPSSVLQVLKISNGNKNNRAIWIDGGIHGNEFMSTSVVTYLANELVNNWNDPLVQNTNWYILPVQNPDGYEYSYKFDRFWQKNRAKEGDAIGVDLNRNYDFEWNKNGNPSDDSYGGKNAFSEHETSTVRDFILETMKGKFDAFISFQGYGQYVMCPKDNDKDVERVAKEGVKRMKAVDNQSYKTGTSQSMFNRSSSGASSEWAKSVGIKYSYTVNLRDTGRYGSLLPPSFIKTTAKEAKAFVWTVLDAVAKEST